MKTITLELLAEKLKGNLWTKGDLKRIYLNKGYNTKKMSTKTWVEESNNGYVVKCYIDCPSQNYNWIKSQQDEVIESVEKQIESIIDLMNVELIEAKLTEDQKEILVNVSFDNQDPIWYTEDEFYNRYDEYPYCVFENLPEIKHFEKKPIISEIETKNIEVQTENIDVKLNQKVKHSKFGIGVVISESVDFIEINFLNPDFGFKKLIKKFVKLEIFE